MPGPATESSLGARVAAYDLEAPLGRASTLPAPLYRDADVAELERRAVFARSWQPIARLEQLAAPGAFVTAEVAGEPVVAVRGQDAVLRAFLNVCRHHAAAVASEPCGVCSVLRCPYHGWTYGLDGALKGTPDFDGVQGFDRSAYGLAPVEVAAWEGLVLARASADGPSWAEQLASAAALAPRLGLGRMRFFERRSYELRCNWKVFVDNYLDGGYHVPFLHRGLDSVLDYARYQIENGERHCLQTSPLRAEGAEAETGAVRRGPRADYLWLYPNLMINVYGGALDTNLVLPLAVDRTRVVFDFYFEDVGEGARERNQESVRVAERIQQEDVAICEAVQRGLGSRAYLTGRLSVRREGGMHLFHRLLAADLRRELGLAAPTR
ncbi:MAG: aromatic ring-hydroxylating dioxygenase subunit alpha [Vicinamibacteria bacterium]